MTEDVAWLVLRDNYLQSQALSVLETRAVSDLLEHAHSIRSLELAGSLDRGLEFLPSAEEIAERHKAGRGLTRPELCDPARLLQDGAVLAPHRLRRARGSVPGPRARALLPAHHAEALRSLSAPAPAASRDHRDGDDQQHGQSHGPDVRAARAGRHWRGRCDCRARLRDRARVVRDARDVEPDRSARHEDQGGHAVRDDVRDDAAAALLHLLADPSSVGQARNRAPGVAPAARPRGARRGAAGRALRRGSRVLREPPRAVSRRERSGSAGEAHGEPRSAALRTGSRRDRREQTKLPVDRRPRACTSASARRCRSTGFASRSNAWRRRPLAGGRAHDSARQHLQPAAHALHAGAERVASARTRSRRCKAWIARHQKAVDYLRQTVADMRSLPEMDFATLSVALQAVRRMAEG